jgi:peptidoglycan/LPS O-acetylase OafA/YrhL
MSPALAKPSDPPRSTSFRSDIEGLRGGAVVLVILYHTGLSFCRGGFVGVDVFFVLSGYLITGLILREIETTGRLDLFHFYARRVRRLLPASALVLITTSIAIVLLLSPVEQVDLARAARSTSAYASNLWFALEASNYFARGIEANPFLHTWSLAVEEQFYLLWPLVLLIGARRGGGRRRVFLIMAWLGIVSLLLSVYMTAHQRVWAFYAMPLRAWEFALGGLACMLPPRRLGARLGWIGMALIAAPAVLYSRNTPFPGLAALVPALGTGLVLASYEGAALGPARLLSKPIWQWVGKLSYSFYLWHWPILALGAALMPELGVMGRVGLALGSLIPAAIAFHAVEQPIRAHRRLAPRVGFTLAGALAVTVLTLSLSEFWRSRSIKETRKPGYARLIAAAHDDSDAVLNRCLANVGEAAPKECVFGARDAATTVVLFGDSHAAHWFPAVQRVAAERSWRVVTLLKAACSPSRVANYYRLVGSVEPECSQWRAETLRRIGEMHPALVLMAGYSGYRKADGQHAFSYSEWRDGTKATLASLAAANVPTALLLDNPVAAGDLPICLGRAMMHGSTSETACEAKLNGQIRAAERDAVRSFPRDSVIDLADQFCDGEFCGPIRHGMVVYRDSNHMTATFAASLASILGKRLRT